MDVVVVDTGADGGAPGVGAEGFDVFLFGKVEKLNVRLREISESAGGPGIYITPNECGDESSERGAEVVGGDVVGGEIEGEFAGERFGGLGASEFAGVVRAEMRIGLGERHAAMAAVGEGEAAEGGAVGFRATSGTGEWHRRRPRCPPRRAGKNGTWGT